MKATLHPNTGKKQHIPTLPDEYHVFNDGKLYREVDCARCHGTKRTIVQSAPSGLLPTYDTCPRCDGNGIELEFVAIVRLDDDKPVKGEFPC